MTANVTVVLTKVSSQGRPFGPIPIEDSHPIAGGYAYLPNPAASTASGVAVPAGNPPETYYVWAITSLTGDAWVAFGTGSPVASIGGTGCYPVPLGTTRYFRAVPGETCAVINGT